MVATATAAAVASIEGAKTGGFAVAVMALVHI